MPLTSLLELPESVPVVVSFPKPAAVSTETAPPVLITTSASEPPGSAGPEQLKTPGDVSTQVPANPAPEDTKSVGIAKPVARASAPKEQDDRSRPPAGDMDATLPFHFVRRPLDGRNCTVIFIVTTLSPQSFSLFRVKILRLIN